MADEKKAATAPAKVRSGRKASMMRYVNEMRWLRNRKRRIERHLKKYPDDLQAAAALGKQ